MPISHGYHVVEDQPFRGGSDDSDCDSVVVQREQIDELELWLFGVFDARIGDGVTKYLQSHLFDRNPKQVSEIASHASLSFKLSFMNKSKNK